MAASLFSQRILDQATAQARPTIDAREDAMHRNAGPTSPIFIDSKLPHDLSDYWNGKVAAAVIGRAVENQQDVLPGKPARQHVDYWFVHGRTRRDARCLTCGPI
jgi:hypothetical protein